MNRKQIKRVRGRIREIASQVVRNEILKKCKEYKLSRDNKKGQLQRMVHHRCSNCGELFRPHGIELDHIKEVGEFKIDGPLRGSRANPLKYGSCRVTNWQEWMDRLFCSLDNFQVLCILCHQKKTLGFNSDVREWRLNGGDLL